MNSTECIIATPSKDCYVRCRLIDAEREKNAKYFSRIISISGTWLGGIVLRTFSWFFVC